MRQDLNYAFGKINIVVVVKKECEPRAIDLTSRVQDAGEERSHGLLVANCRCANDRKLADTLALLQADHSVFVIEDGCEVINMLAER